MSVCVKEQLIGAEFLGIGSEILPEVWVVVDRCTCV